MQLRKSSVSVVPAIPQAQRKAIGEAFNNQQAQANRQAGSRRALTGVPGDPDQRKFLTAPFANLMPVHTTENSSLAYNSNSQQWRDYAPGHYDGLMAPPGEFDSRPYYFTDLTADPVIVKTTDTVTPPNRAVSLNRAVAGPLSTNVLQDKEAV